MKGVTRSKASGKQGTRKEMQCQGRELGFKPGGGDSALKCGFKVALRDARGIEDRAWHAKGWERKRRRRSLLPAVAGGVN